MTRTPRAPALVALLFAAAALSACARPTPTPTPTAPATPSVPQGAQVFLEVTGPTCASCHTIEGLPGADGVVGPELTHIGTVAGTRVPGLSAEEYIRQSIQQPGAFVVEGFPDVMPPGLRDQMSDEQFEALVQYLLSLR